MSHQNSRSPQPDNQNNPSEVSHSITRRSIVLGTLVALVPITALAVTALGTLLTMLSHTS